MIELPVIDHAAERPREECGVCCAYTPGDTTAARLVMFMLHALQHRGQEAAGISALIDGAIRTRKDVGLVGQVFGEWEMESLESDMAIGHVRYSTTGDSTRENAQPHHHTGRRTVALAHNGNLTNAGRLRRELEADGIEFQTTSDSEALAAIVATSGASARGGMVEAMRRAKGAYSLCVLADGKLLACRDAYGIRPLVLGRLGKGYVVASETCALDIIGATYMRDVMPGELIEISDQGLRTWDVLPASGRGCSLEAIYFARPDSKLGLETVAATRRRLGIELAREYTTEADIVVPVPNSGRPMALGYAEVSGLPAVEAIVKNEYVQRTFIKPTQAERKLALRMKFNVISSEVCGRRVVVVDDSLIRGNTMRLLIEMLREAGAEQVHVRIASPPTRHPCFYGIDMGLPEDHIAVDADGQPRSAEVVRDDIGADSLHYLTAAGLSRAFERPLRRRCTACFTGEYPIEIEDKGKDLFELADVPLGHRDD